MTARSAMRAIVLAMLAVPGVALAQVCKDNTTHARHVNAGIDCSSCHPKGAAYGFDVVRSYPRGTSTSGGTLTLANTSTPTTCMVACHFPMGGSPKAVNWTAPGPLACTACHEAQTLSPAHPPVAETWTRADCATCHTEEGHTGGAIGFVPHVAGWSDPASSSFHAFSADRGLGSCRQCHGAELTGGATGIACGQCHDGRDAAGNAVPWRTNCTMCHGDKASARAEPPQSIWGYGADAVRTGAHASHLSPSAIAPASDCAACHVRPGDALDDRHIDEVAAGDVPKASLAFGGLALRDGSAPSWDRASATCANVYCHGGTLRGGTNTAPVWTRLDGTQAACGACHGLPPPDPHPVVAADLKTCSGCHAETVDPTGAVIPPSAGGRHLDGIVESAGHDASWTSPASPGFHAYSANQGLAQCQTCHGADLSGGSAQVACGKCHDRNLPAGVTSWKENCVMCHGGVDNQTGAPPRTTWGKSADAVRAGSHSRHVGVVECAVCHVIPADAISPGHVDGTVASVRFAGLAIAGGAAPSWDRNAASCSSTYCHGNFRNGNAGYAPSWTTPTANACGTCHGLPPGGTHPTSTHCASCHTGYTATSVNPALHLNGTVEVLDLTCASCHGEPGRAATPQNPQLAAAPPLDTLGNSDPSARGVGAHGRHLQRGAAGDAVACTECHTVPTSVTHESGQVELAFGPLATAGGVAPSWSGATCSSTYCHGSFAFGNAAYAPVWTVAQTDACGTCHGIPPAKETGHVQRSDCGTCHDGYTSGTVNVALHLNGRSDVSALACTACHGDANRAATALNPNLAVAPPLDTSGSSSNSSPGVGAHMAHLNAGPIAPAFACAECHAAPASPHPNGTVAFSWGALATGRGALSPAYAGGTCSATWCHGGGLTGGSNTRPAWTVVDGSQSACGTCHGLPPASLPGPNHPAYLLKTVTCASCHPETATVVSGQNTVLAGGGKHVNGAVEFTDRGHAAGWVKANDPGCGGTHGCLPPIDGYKHNAYFGACTGCHGDGVDFTVAGGTSGVSCSACHLNAFASTTCGMLGTSPPCSCDLCHAVPQVRIP